MKFYRKSSKRVFLSWEDVKGGNEHPFLTVTNKNFHGSRQLDSKARKVLKYGIDNVSGLNAFGKVSDQKNELQQIYYIKHSGSGIRAPFFRLMDGVLIGIFVFYKQDVDSENARFEVAAKTQESIIKWIEEYEDLFKEVIQGSQ